MIAIDFGSRCFNMNPSEESVLLVIAPKSLYSSMDEFVTKALQFLESDKEMCDNWREVYKNRSYSEATEEDKSWMKSRLEAMNHQVHIVYEPIISAVHIIPPRWNDITLGVETEEEYIFYSWGTAA